MTIFFDIIAVHKLYQFRRVLFGNFWFRIVRAFKEFKAGWHNVMWHNVVYILFKDTHDNDKFIQDKYKEQTLIKTKFQYMVRIMNENWKWMKDLTLLKSLCILIYNIGSKCLQIYIKYFIRRQNVIRNYKTYLHSIKVRPNA